MWQFFYLLIFFNSPNKLLKKNFEINIRRMAKSPIYENDAAITQQSFNRIHNTQRSNSHYTSNGSGSSAQNRYPNIGPQAGYRQQPETTDIYLTSINRNQVVNHNNTRRERRRNHAISMYDEDNYALAGPITRNSSEEEIEGNKMALNTFIE